jgi:DNA repair ATPase RecN
VINKITIKNFRSHEDTVIELHPGVNAIIGRGQAGKTNIKRALEWVADNRPLGTKFISWWAKGDPTQVMVEVSNPEGLYMVTMTKGMDSSATYTLEGPGWREPQVFETVGTKVPDAVRRVLNLDAVNMQAQLAQPYLVTGSKGDISRAVNRVIQIEVADKWLTVLNSRDTRNRQHLKALEAVVDSQQANANRLANVPKADEFLVAAELEDTRLGVAQRRADNLIHLLDDLAYADQRLGHITGIVEPLEQAVNAAEAAQVAIDDNQRAVVKIEDLWRTEQEINGLMGAYQRLAEQYVALLEELGQCPTCLSPVDEHIITQLKEEL